MSPNTTPSAPPITARRTAPAPPAVRGGDTGSDVVCTVRSSFSSRTLSKSDWMRYGRVAVERINPKLAMSVRAQSQLQRSPVRRRDHIPIRSDRIGFGGLPMGLVGVQIVQQSLHGGPHLVEGLLADNGRPLRFDRGHPVAGMGHHSTSPLGQADELGASVTGIRLPVQGTKLLEVA